MFFNKTITYDRQFIVILKWKIISTDNMFPSIKFMQTSPKINKDLSVVGIFQVEKTQL